mmetsp:Transcript_8865/g.12871  ORF Transcript_8865/g.12871 Transcript_8865/m.12871 type:complete len:217 (+) Transcript_8865:2628-3278(+)
MSSIITPEFLLLIKVEVVPESMKQESTRKRNPLLISTTFSIVFLSKMTESKTIELSLPLIIASLALFSSKLQFFNVNRFSYSKFLLLILLLPPSVTIDTTVAPLLFIQSQSSNSTEDGLSKVPAIELSDASTSVKPVTATSCMLPLSTICELPPDSKHVLGAAHSMVTPLSLIISGANPLLSISSISIDKPSQSVKTSLPIESRTSVKKVSQLSSP